MRVQSCWRMWSTYRSTLALIDAMDEAEDDDKNHEVQDEAKDANAED